MVTEIEEFGDFAELKLNNHMAELYTIYGQRSPYPDEKMVEAYNRHQKILSVELEQKLNTLLKGCNLEPVVKEGLLGIKRKYENNLIWNKR